MSIVSRLLNLYSAVGKAPRLSLLLLLIFMAPAPLQGGPFVKIDSIDQESEYPNIRLYVSVSGADHLPAVGMNEENLLVYEDGFRVNYVNVRRASTEKEVIYFVFSIDTSKSVRPRDLQNFKKAARDIIERADPEDMFAVYRFNDEVKILNSFTSNRPEIIKNIEGISAHGSKTSLLNSIYDSIDLLSRVDRHRKAVIVFTDGMDEGSSVSVNDVVAIAKETMVPLYFVCMKPSGKVSGLARMAKLTGGRLLAGSSHDDIEGMYKLIKSMLQSRYLVQYKSMLKRDGKAHAVEVRLKFDSLRDRDARELMMKRGFEGIEFPSVLQVILIVLVLLLSGLLLFLALYLLRRGGWRIRRDAGRSPALPGISDFRRSIDIDEQMKQNRDRLITPEDPEYIYSRAWLVEKDGPDAGKKFPIFWEEMTLGRDEENGIVIRDEAVSLKHARIKEIKGAFYIFDLASENFTYLNGKKLLRPKPLYDWDEIRIGRTVFIFRGSKIA